MKDSDTTTGEMLAILMFLTLTIAAMCYSDGSTWATISIAMLAFTTGTAVAKAAK